MSFKKALALVLKAEGGYVDHPADKGGATNRGITQATYDRYRANARLSKLSVQCIEPYEVEAIYREYWDKGFCALMPSRLGVLHFDACVNHGLTGAVKLLQEACNVSKDGIIGPETFRVIFTTPEDSVIASYLLTREQFYRGIVEGNPSQAVFLEGWLARIKQLRKELNGTAGKK